MSRRTTIITLFLFGLVIGYTFAGDELPKIRRERWVTVTLGQRDHERITAALKRAAKVERWLKIDLSRDDACLLIDALNKGLEAEHQWRQLYAE